MVRSLGLRLFHESQVLIHLVYSLLRFLKNYKYEEGRRRMGLGASPRVGEGTLACGSMCGRMRACAGTWLNPFHPVRLLFTYSLVLQY